jgi:peptidoglycan/xylan/chitin deacetylase (PgdA/CDA1 family)
MIAAAFRALSPAGPKAALSVFIFHRVLPTPDTLMPWEPDIAQFDWMCRLIGRNFRVLDLADAVRLRAAGRLPAAAAAISFDDGYADNAECALPVLQRHGLTATFFVSTGFTEGGRMWNDEVIESVRRAPLGSLDFEHLGLGRYQLDGDTDRIAAYQDLLRRIKYLPMEERSRVAGRLAATVGPADAQPLMMNAGQILRLRDAGMGIGGHTVNHPILAQLPDAEARVEISQGRHALQCLTGQEIPLFAYPNGKPGEDYLPRHARMVEEAGFIAGLTTVPTVAYPGDSCWELPRYTPWQRGRSRFTWACAVALMRGRSRAAS